MAASAAAMTDADSFLPALTKSLSELNAQPAMPTAEFCRAMSLILPVFDHLGAPCRPLSLFADPIFCDHFSSSAQPQIMTCIAVGIREHTSCAVRILIRSGSPSAVRRRLLRIRKAGDGREGEHSMLLPVRTTFGQ